MDPLKKRIGRTEFTIIIEPAVPKWEYQKIYNKIKECLPEMVVFSAVETTNPLDE